MDSYEETFRNMIGVLSLEDLQELSKRGQVVAHAARDNSTFQAAKRTKLRIDCEIGRRRAQPVAVFDSPHSMNDSGTADFWDQILQGLTNFEALKKNQPVNGSKPQPTTPYVCLTDYTTGEPVYCDFTVDPPLMIKAIKAPNYNYTSIKTTHVEYTVRETADEVLLATRRGSFKPTPRWTAKIAR